MRWMLYHLYDIAGDYLFTMKREPKSAPLPMNDEVMNSQAMAEHLHYILTFQTGSQA